MELKRSLKKFFLPLFFTPALAVLILSLFSCDNKPEVDPNLEYPPLYKQIGHSDAQIRFWRETKTNSTTASSEDDSIYYYTSSDQPSIRYGYIFTNHICKVITVSIITDNEKYSLNKFNVFFQEWGFKRIDDEYPSFGKDEYVSFLNVGDGLYGRKKYTLVILKSNENVKSKYSDTSEYIDFYKLLGQTRSDIENSFGKRTRQETIDGRIVDIHDIKKDAFYIFDYRNDKVLRSSLVIDETDTQNMKKTIDIISKKVRDEGYKEIDFSNGISTVSNGKINIQFKSEPTNDKIRLIFNSYFIDPTVLGVGWSQSDFGNEYTNKLYLSIEDDNVRVVKEYVNAGWDLESMNGELDQTILSYACAYGSFEVVKYLISKGANVNARGPRNNFTPLTFAFPVSGAPSEFNYKKQKVFLYLLRLPEVDIFYESSPNKNVLDLAMLMAPENQELIQKIREELKIRKSGEKVFSKDGNGSEEYSSGGKSEVSVSSMVFVEGGNFQIGTYDKKYNNPIQNVFVNSFLIDKYEVTQKEFEKVMGYNPSFHKCSNCPVENLTCDEAVQYANKVGKRLPSEIEWEYAARGGVKSKGYNYSGSNEVHEIGYGPSGYFSPLPVGEKKPNELGIYDMTGNVCEWCGDPQNGFNFRRGGSIILTNYVFERRSRYDYSEEKSFDIGFRCVKDVEKK